MAPMPPCDGYQPRIHVATLISQVIVSMSAFMATATWNFGQVTMLDDGKGGGWPPKKKIENYRKYLHRLPDDLLCDFILLVDAYDALILAPPEKLAEIMLGMEQRTGFSSFFGTETHCGVNCSQQEQLALAANVTTPNKYLNSGLQFGRLWNLRQFYSEPADVSKMVADQDWCINVTLSIPGIAGLDYQQELFMNAFGVEGIWDGQRARDLGQPAGAIAYMEDETGQWVENRLTGTRPPILHFPGFAKFPQFFACFEQPSLTCAQSLPFELVRRFYPTAYKGWSLDRMQRSLDDYGMAFFLRTFWSPGNFHYQRLWELADKLKRRDRVISGLATINLVVLLLVARWYRRKWWLGPKSPQVTNRARNP